MSGQHVHLPGSGRVASQEPPAANSSPSTASSLQSAPRPHQPYHADILRWVRTIGDVVFIVSALAVCWQVVKGLFLPDIPALIEAPISARARNS
ncbi:MULTISPECIES: hypothetical protein [unclassified Microbulbifer]|uniref:hypothetical protein n=1 Tax=unclassified Microbulbifer TaxID=2619833 RepID=UPI0027E5AFCA|nr:MULTISPECIES: hypothetical protein [unclassified Microbulbifer]